jgi:hypothetical protein
MHLILLSLISFCLSSNPLDQWDLLESYEACINKIPEHGVVQLPNNRIAKFCVKNLRSIYFIGERQSKNMSRGAIKYWTSQLEPQYQFITAKDGVSLFTRYAEVSESNRTLILFGSF